MATTSRGPKGRRTTKSSTARAAKPATRARKPATALESARDTAGGYAGTVLKTIRARPLAAASLAAGTAGTVAFLWAKRALIGEQAAVAREKIGDLREQASDQAGVLRAEAGEKAKAFRGKLNERFFATEEATEFDAAGEVRGRGRPNKLQNEISQEALTLKQLGDSEPMLDDQSKVGAIAY